MEQLLFSQQDPIPRSDQHLYDLNTKRMLLLCGMDDTGGNLCQETRNLAPKMDMTPGHALFLQTTGHSIHNERPNYLAQQITAFVDATPSQGTTTATNGPVTGIVVPAQPALSATVCPTLDGKSCTQVSSRLPGAPLRDIVTVKAGSTPIAGVSVSVMGQPTETSLTNASGVAVITHLACYEPSARLPRVGQAAFPARMPVPCEATVSKTGYQSSSFTLP
jgi:hypothetical protein